MRIDDIEQEANDFDWFAADLNGHLTHFASGGGVLPASVATSWKELNELSAYFRALPIINTTVHITPYLTQIVTGKKININQYMASFVYYAQRGLFSFDKTEITHPRLNNSYHLVAYPSNTISLKELPTDIATLVFRTKLPFAVSGRVTLDTSDLQ